MYPTGLEGSLAASWHRGFFGCNTSVGVYLPANVGMIFESNNSCCMLYFSALLNLNCIKSYVIFMLLKTYNI